MASKDINPRSVDGFCARWGFSRGHFYNMLREGRGPRTMKVGSRTLISPEAEDEWRRRVEAETATREVA